MKLSVYGASSNRIDDTFIEAGEKLGEAIADRGHEVIFGGGGSGMMGAVARGAHSHGGKVTGIAPAFFKVDGVLYDKCDEFIYPDDMRSRKKLLDEMADGFIITPGGPGTLDEFFEILTLKQLSIHRKPIVIFNINGYYDSLIKLMEDMISKCFMTAKNKSLWYVSSDIDDTLNYIENYKPVELKLSDLKEIK